MNSNRRNFLKGAGVTLALPWLETFAASVPQNIQQRLLLIGVPLGLYKDAFLPKESGSSYQASEYLSIINQFRNNYTIISGLEHEGVNGGHSAESRLFTAVPSHMKNKSSLDQYLAQYIGKNTRFDSLALSAGSNNFSWTAGGSMVPAESKMANIYSKLFVEEKAASKAKVLAKLKHGQSIMDFVFEDAKSMSRKLTKSDRQKLEEYFENVRATEKQLLKAESWVNKPKPKINAKNNFSTEARDADIVKNYREVCDMTHLAFQTDSTRIITFGYFRQNDVVVPGVKSAYHALSHHGMDKSNIEQLNKIESQFFIGLKNLLSKLKNSKEGNGSMLDNTTIVVSSNLGNGNNHSTKNLPVIVAGGRYKHGQHLAYREGRYPLSNLFVSILHQFGVMDKSFATSTGPLKNFELV
ncbi:MAG: DUF1552 domain-containing protein [Lentisphaerales bacterium]|nr:DUF1552 domain-containing protein [Lentisphaerales bacterium]